MSALADPEEVRAHLIGAASAGLSLTYGELIERLGYVFSRPKVFQLCVLLSEVDAVCVGRGEPQLAVLVVRQADRLPGQGWWLSAARAHGYDGPWEGPEARAFVNQLQQGCFDRWCQAGTAATDTES